MTRSQIHTQCVTCGTALVLEGQRAANHRQGTRPFCGQDCVREKRRQDWLGRRAAHKTTCAECLMPVTLTKKGKIDAWKRSGRAYCSDTCRDTWVARDRSQRLSATNKRHASARMKARNPMARPEVRKKMSDTLKRIGHRPPQGGNGHGLTEPQRVLSGHLGWQTEVPIVIGDGEVPWAYSADIAHPSMKVIIEVDGGSHYSLKRRAADRRRDARLASIGWLTFRFSNKDAMELTAECAAMVLSTTWKWQERTPTS